MKAVFNKTLTEVNIKTQLEQLVTEYHEANTLLQDGIRAVNQQFKENAHSDMYTPEYLRTHYEQSKDSVLNNALNKAKLLNEKAVQAVAFLKSKAVPALSTDGKPNDYAARVNNALQFVQLEGAEITDETAFQILREFIGDMETMKRFRNVVAKQISAKGEHLTDGLGNTVFPLTFGKLYNYEQFISALNELEEMASLLFVRKMAQTESEYLHGVTVSVPTDSYMQLMTERNIIEQAETVETMIKELFNTTTN